VTITCGSVSMESVEKDKIDLGLDRLRPNRRCAKRLIPIRAKMATAPPMMPPAIAVMFRFLGDGSGALGIIGCAGTLREVS
jgi:hypothetical protein